MEAGVRPILEDFAARHGLYLDKQGERPCRKGRKCTWIDANGNAHDLDFVLERGGTAEKTGLPVAFIETAWRRYTKHSRNKAQEIQGAILPLAQTYSRSAPFKGAILAGVFTEGALAQMRSLGFNILFFPYEMILEVFRRFGLDASSEEKTPDSRFQAKVRRYERLTEEQRGRLPVALMEANKPEVNRFLGALTAVISRHIERISVLPLHGAAQECLTIEEAMSYIERYEDPGIVQPVQRYEIQVRFSNGDVIEGRFGDKQGAIAFLAGYNAC